MVDPLELIASASISFKEHIKTLDKKDRGYPILNNLICFLDLSAAYIKGDLGLDTHLWELRCELEAFEREVENDVNSI